MNDEPSGLFSSARNQTGEISSNEIPEETILTEQDAFGNTAIHLMFNNSSAEIVKEVLRTSLVQYKIPIQHLLNSVNKAGRKPQDMSCEAGFKAEIKEFVEKLIQRGPPKGNSLLSSQKRGRSIQPSLTMNLRK